MTEQYATFDLDTTEEVTRAINDINHRLDVMDHRLKRMADVIDALARPAAVGQKKAPKTEGSKE